MKPISCKPLAAVALLLLFSAPSAGAPLIDEIEDLRSDESYRERIAELKNKGFADLKQALNEVLDAAIVDLDGAQVEREILQNHAAAIRQLAERFDRYEQLQSFGEVATNQFKAIDDDDCEIADETFPNHVVYDCDAEYRYAIDVWRRTETVRSIIDIWKGVARDDSVRRIRESEVRWDQFASKVTSDQFPWETIINGWLVEGTIATPPRLQFRLLHPIAVLSYAEEEGEYDEEIGVEVFGLRSYGEQYDPEWGLSVFALLESGNATDTGWGVSLSRKNFNFAVVAQDTLAKEDDTKVLLGYNLASLFENKKNALADKQREVLRQLDQFKSDLANLVN